MKDLKWGKKAAVPGIPCQNLGVGQDLDQRMYSNETERIQTLWLQVEN